MNNHIEDNFYNVLLTKNKHIFSYFILQKPYLLLPVFFLALCLFGVILLSLPYSKAVDVPLIDVIFTTVSAVCVTGLSTLSIEKAFTPFGQSIICILIQLGGLGIMSVTSLIVVLLGKTVSISYERTTKSIFGADSYEEIKRVFANIMKYTLLTELSGAVILSAVFSITESNTAEGIKLGFFTAISAFCNAGFFLKSTSLTTYATNPLLIYTVAILAVAGSLPPTIITLFSKEQRHKKLSIFWSVVLITSASLTVFGLIFFFISEYNGILNGLSLADKINNSFFQSIATRSVGFNTINISAANAATVFCMMFLMFIGGSPGGTAGGIKTASFAILMITCHSLIKGQANVVRNRHIPEETVRQAIVLSISFIFIIAVFFIMLFATQKINAHKLLFEIISAMGTTGLSLGITSLLNETGKIIIILAMFVGRVFPATFIYYLNSRFYSDKIIYPEEKIHLT